MMVNSEMMGFTWLRTGARRPHEGDGTHIGARPLE